MKLLFKLFHEPIMKYAFESKYKGKFEDFDKMEMVFLDSEGRKYFSYLDPMEIPVVRRRQLEIKLLEADSGVSLDILNLWLDNIDKECESVDPKKAVLNISRLSKSLRERTDLGADVELLMKICCIIYVREDQNPHVWNEKLEEEKFEQLMKDRAGGLYDFFIMTGLSEFLPFLKGMEKGFKEYSMLREQEIKMYHRMLEKHLSIQL